MAQCLEILLEDPRIREAKLWERKIRGNKVGVASPPSHSSLAHWLLKALLESFMGGRRWKLAERLLQEPSLARALEKPMPLLIRCDSAPVLQLVLDHPNTPMDRIDVSISPRSRVLSSLIQVDQVVCGGRLGPFAAF